MSRLFIICCFVLFVQPVLSIRVDNFEHYLCRNGVKLRADVLFYLLTHHILRKVFSVAAVRGHSVVAVSHGDYPRKEGYLLAGDTVWVALAVVALVVPACADRQLLQALYLGKYLIAP